MAYHSHLTPVRKSDRALVMHEGRIELLAPKNIKLEMSGQNRWSASSAQQDPARDAPPPSPALEPGDDKAQEPAP